MMAVVLARGSGQRMRAPDASTTLSAAQQAAAAAGAKVLMPVGEGRSRPFLDFALSALADAGCTDACLVVAPDHGALRERYASRPDARLRVHFAVQEHSTGTAAAVGAAAPVVGDNPFLVVNGDNLYPPEAVRTLVLHEGCALAAFSRDSLVHRSGFALERVARFATVQADESGYLTGMAEKPTVDAVAGAAAPRISMNLWRFNRQILDACCDVPPSSRGEHELPDAVMLAVSRGARVRVLDVDGAVLDLTSRADVPVVSQRLAGMDARP